MYTITGITGKVDGTLARKLLVAGQPVRAVVRDAAKGQAWAEKGCEVAIAEMEDAQGAGKGLRRVRGRLYLAAFGRRSRTGLHRSAQGDRRSRERLVFKVVRMKMPLLYTITVMLSSASAGAVAQTPPWQSADPKVRAAVDELVTANKILAHEGIFASYGHISVRSPSDSNRLLISRSLAPDRVAAADIVELDLDCNPIGATQVLLYQERFIHCAIYRARPDVKSVVHSHTPYMMAFSVSDVPLRPVINAAQMMSSDPVPVYDTSTSKLVENNLIASPQSGRDLARTLGKGPVVLMRGHGSTVVASTVQGAVITAIAMEQNAMILLNAKLLGGHVTYLDPKSYGNERINRETGPEARDWNHLKAKALKQEGSDTH